MKSGSIYLIGGGEIRNKETEIIDNHIISNFPKDSNFVFFPTAANDSKDYIQTIESIFSGHFHVTHVKTTDIRETIISAIKNASVIYIGGGNTQLLVEFFIKHNIIPTLKESYNNGLCIVGMSAGALALSNLYIHEENNTLLIKKGWGLLNQCLLVHASENNLQEALKLARKYNIKKNLFIGIEEGTALYIANHKTKILGTGKITQQ